MHPDSTIPQGFCQCGCGRRTPIASFNDNRRGVAKGEPYRFVRGHSSPPRRFRPESDVDIDPSTGCWVWRHGGTKSGYGQLGLYGKVVYAHRWVYETLVGPIPADMDIDHLCSNRRCVNPDHLEPVPHIENMRRAGMVSLTPDDIRVIRSLAGTATQREIAARFGVTRSRISTILSGKGWKHVDH